MQKYCIYLLTGKNTLGSLYPSFISSLDANRHLILKPLFPNLSLPPLDIYSDTLTDSSVLVLFVTWVHMWIPVMPQTLLGED